VVVLEIDILTDSRGGPLEFIGRPNINRVHQGGAESKPQDTHNCGLAAVEMVGYPHQSECW
jgi:hypothetical protein